jgi:hypothetical protein
VLSCLGRPPQSSLVSTIVKYLEVTFVEKQDLLTILVQFRTVDRAFDARI